MRELTDAENRLVVAFAREAFLQHLRSDIR